MKKRVKIIFTFLLAFLLAFTAFGCKPDQVASGELDEGYKPVVEGKIKLAYYIASTEADKRSVRDWVATFEKKYPDCDVQQELSTVGKDQIAAQIAAKTIGDVFFLWETDVYNYAVNQNALMQLDSYVEAYGIDTSNVFSSIYDMGVVNGKLYMVMRDYNHIVLTYNRTAINSIGLDDPVELDKAGNWTWDTFKNYCAQLTTSADADTPMVGASLRLGYAPVYIPFLEGFGGEWYDTVNKKVKFISDERVLQGVNEMVDFVKTNTVKYNPVSVDNLSAKLINESASQTNYNGYDATSQIVFQDTEFPNFARLGNSYENAGLEWDVVSFPALPTHKVGTGCTGFAVFNKTKNPDAAAALCLSLYTEEGQRAYNGQEGGSVPNVRSLADDTFWRVPFTDSTLDSENGKYYTAFISYPDADTYAQVECVLPPDIAVVVKKYMINVVPDAVNGTKDVSTTLGELEAEANGLWETIYTG